MSNQREALLYDGEIKLVFNPESTHRYTANGKVIPGVTSVLSVLNKEFLKQWAASMSAEYFRASVEALVQSGVAIEAKHLAAIELKAKEAHNQHSKKATDLGTLVHEATELFDGSGEIQDLGSETANTMLQRYVDWRLNQRWDPQHIEKLVYSRSLEYAGTIDRIFKKPSGELVLADIKTSKPSAYNQMGVYDEYHAQLGGYMIAVEEMGIHIDGLAVVNPDKVYGEFHVFELDSEAVEAARRLWLSTLETWKNLNRCKYHNKKQNALETRVWYAQHKGE